MAGLKPQQVHLNQNPPLVKRQLSLQIFRKHKLGQWNTERPKPELSRDHRHRNHTAHAATNKPPPDNLPVPEPRVQPHSYLSSQCKKRIIFWTRTSLDSVVPSQRTKLAQGSIPHFPPLVIHLVE